MEEYRRARREPPVVPHAPAPVSAVTFAFDLRSAWTYLAAERVDRSFRQVRWVPVILPGTPTPGVAAGSSRARVEARAAALRMPLVWPDRDEVAGLGAMRVAAFAAECGQAAAFVLAAGRLAYCGGFDLDDPEILAEAADAACLPLEHCLRAFGDRARDDAMRQAGKAMLSAGAASVPALLVDGRWFAGEERLGEAAAAARAPVLLDARQPVH